MTNDQELVEKIEDMQVQLNYAGAWCLDPSDIPVIISLCRQHDMQMAIESIRTADRYDTGGMLNESEAIEAIRERFSDE